MAAYTVGMPTRLPKLVAAKKALAFVPIWAEQTATSLGFLVPLEIDGVVVEGLTLRGKACTRMADREVMFQMEYRHNQIAGGPCCRIEWLPLNGHSNKGVGPAEFRHFLQTGSHHHRFDLNWKRSQEAVWRGELPIAVPIAPEPKNFRALLGLVGSEFTISDLQRIPLPPWQPAML